MCLNKELLKEAENALVMKNGLKKVDVTHSQDSKCNLIPPGIPSYCTNAFLDASVQQYKRVRTMPNCGYKPH